jgi:hypothetical protein
VLQEKYGIRSIPYFIMIYEGRTVQVRTCEVAPRTADHQASSVIAQLHAHHRCLALMLFAQLTNNISTGQELHAASLAAIGKGRRGNFLPDSYKVSGGTDNQLLDSISPSMSLRY